MTYGHEQISFSEVDEHLDSIAREGYQNNHDKIRSIEKAMGSFALVDNEYLETELRASHFRATEQLKMYRPWLAKRDLIDQEEMA